MPTYTFIGAIGRVFTDLRNGVGGVLVRPVEGAPPEPGTTVLLEPGDTLVSDEPIVHCELWEETPTRAVEAPTPAPARRVPVPPVEAAEATA